MSNNYGYLAGHRHGETASHHEPMVLTTTGKDFSPSRTMDLCRVCHRPVVFTTDGDGQVVAHERRTWKRHPCKNP